MVTQAVIATSTGYLFRVLAKTFNGFAIAAGIFGDVLSEKVFAMQVAAYLMGSMAVVSIICTLLLPLDSGRYTGVEVVHCLTGFRSWVWAGDVACGSGGGDDDRENGCGTFSGCRGV